MTLQLEKLKRDLDKKGLAPATIKHCLVLVRQMYNKAIAWGLYEGTNPVTWYLKISDKSVLEELILGYPFSFIKILYSFE